MCLRFIEKHRIKKQIKNTTLDPKGVCLAIYCAKIFGNCLKNDEIIYAYENDLRDMHMKVRPNNPYYDYDERQEIAYDYLTMALNCKNGEYVRKRIEEDLSDD